MDYLNRIKKGAVGLSQKGLERLFADDKRAGQIATVIGRIQRGKAAFDTAQVTVMHQLSFASKADFKELGKQLSSVRRRVRALDEKLTSA